MEFDPKSPIVWRDNDEIVLDANQENAFTEEWEDGDTPETNIDGLSEYAYGFWFRYLTMYPK